jgi:hypothetical protein
MNSTPTTVRQTAPSPPRMLVPPTTMPARTVNVSVLSLVDCALSTREESITPASAAARALPSSTTVRARDPTTKLLICTIPPQRPSSVLY